jgi:ABC-type branched-subunit amino acid transport system ATPase component
MPLLRISALRASYGPRCVIDGLDLTVHAGERLALIGPNGCGKSTLLRAIAGDAVDRAGRIELDGQGVAGWSTERIVAHGVGYLRQVRNIFPGLSVGDNLRMAAQGARGGRPANPRRIEGALPELIRHADSRAGLLSGGLRQMLALAMILVRPVSLLLLDEPLAGLAPDSAADLLQRIARLQADDGFAMLIVEHRLRIIQRTVDRVVVMSRGSVCEDTGDVSILSDQARLAALHAL